MKKNKGFTLVELLAVIVILAVIALIATPVVLSMIESSRKGAAESSMLSYVDAAEKTIVTQLMSNAAATNYDQTYHLSSTSTLILESEGFGKDCVSTSTPKQYASYTSGTTCASGYKENPDKTVKITVDLKGNQPDAAATGSSILVEGNVVKEAKLKFSKYYVSYFYNKATGTTTYCSADDTFPTSC